jgi:hypothetical protein
MEVWSCSALPLSQSAARRILQAPCLRTHCGHCATTAALRRCDKSGGKSGHGSGRGREQEGTVQYDDYHRIGSAGGARQPVIGGSRAVRALLCRRLPQFDRDDQVWLTPA